ncbi:MAG: DapH/DapD/GlmU-related protein [Phycisphaerae bacterium]
MTRQTAATSPACRTSDCGLEKHETASIATSARFDIGGGGRVLLGPNCQIRDGAHFEVHDEGVVDIGPRAVIGVNNWIQGNGDVTIGPDTILGPGVVVTSTHHQMDLAFPIQDQPLAKRPIVIGRDVWLGANATVLSGVTIGDHAVIGANSLVNRDVQAAAIIGGCPAREIGRRRRNPVRRRLIFAIALGITDRPERWEAVAGFFVTMGNTLREAGVDSWYVCHPAAARPLSRVRKDRRIITEAHAGFERILKQARPDVVFIWNGGSDGDRITERLAAEADIPCRFGELGWFPQSKTLYFDTDGTNARSSIRRMDLSVRPVDPRLDGWLDRWRQSQAAAPPDRSGYVFVPLQDERDLNITLASPYPTMDAFVSALAARFPSETLIVRPHPQFPDVRLTPHPRVEVRRDGSLGSWLKHAVAVVGINSTVLIESLAWGKPTHAVGAGLASGLDVMFEAGAVESLVLRREVDAARHDRTKRLLSELIFVRQINRKDLHYLDRLRAAHGVSDLLREDEQSGRAQNHQKDLQPADAARSALAARTR